MEEYRISENERLKKELGRIDMDFRRSVAALIICAIIVVAILVKWFPFQ